MKIEKKVFGHLDDGSHVTQYVMTNNQLEVSLINFGCIINSIKTTDSEGNIGEVVLGFDNLEDYLKPHPYFGAIVGPVANRISGAKYVVDGEQFILDANEGENQLHGGALAFDKMLWTEDHLLENDDCVQVNLSYLRPHGLMGFPGNLNVKFSLSLYANNRIDLNYKCRTDCSTPVNITHHDYFNLTDGGKTSILQHLVKINAYNFTPTKEDNCVTGEIKPVKNTAFDFTNFKSVKVGILEMFGELVAPKGIDHNFVLSGDLPIAATVRCDKTKRQLDIYTNKDCVQFYTSNHLDGTLGRQSNEYKAFNALCLETQSFPDAVNQKLFPNVILHPDEVYDYFTSYVFSNF